MESVPSNAPLSNVPEKSRTLSRGGRLVLFVGVFLSLALFATCRTPIPGTNEPHYLTKARVFWEPGWCARDPFLQSTPVHVVFYALLGGPAAWWGFEPAAWIGRILGWACLAWGWTKCARALSLSNLAAMTALWIYLCLAAVGNFSGEWMVGGTEGKVFSYGGVLLSLAAVMEGRTIAAGAWGGVAVAFHPVVGAWHAIALAGIQVASLGIHFRTALEESSPVQWMKSSAVWLMVSLPGLIPALFLIQPTSAEGEIATRLQVYERLAHHLDPRVFPVSGYVCYGLLLVVLLWLWGRSPKSETWGFLCWYVVVTAGIAAVGLVAGWLQLPNGYVVPRLLKIYPFRMFDIFLPLTVAMLIAKTIAPTRSRWKIVEGLVCGGLVMVGTFGVASDRNPSHLPPEMWTDWQTVCGWIRKETPKEALFLTSNRGFAFKWFAERAELFSYKDCPQDNAGILAWDQRRNDLWEWFHDGFFEPELRKLRKETGCDYLVITRGTPCHLRSVYHNDSFVVYQIPPEWK